MNDKLSKRLSDIVQALPLKPGIRVLEIGCGPGAMARAICRLIGHGHVLGIDRSKKAIQQAVSGSQREIKAGLVSYRLTAIEHFELDAGELPFDLAVAIRVGALDGRHPAIEEKALNQIAKALTKKGRLYIDGGDPLKEISIDAYR